VGFQVEEGWLWQVGEVTEVLDNPLGERNSGLQGGTAREDCWLGLGRSHTGDSHINVLLGATSPGAQEHTTWPLLNVVVHLRLPGQMRVPSRDGVRYFLPSNHAFDKRDSPSPIPCSPKVMTLCIVTLHMPALRGWVTPNQLTLNNICADQVTFPLTNIGIHFSKIYRVVCSQCLNCKSNSWTLARKELFALSTPLTLATRASQPHLLAAGLSAVKMSLCNVRQRLDKHRMAIQTL
jgi:hypothetical protein